MNVQRLIDAIVRQTTVLIAQLATTGGIRAPLAHVADQVFSDLARELSRQGVTRRVSADMFGMALRTYQRRTQRLSESATAHGQSLWEAVLSYLRGRRTTSRSEVLLHFAKDDEAQLRGVLHDLTESGLVFCTGAGEGVTYRATTDEELGDMGRPTDEASLDALLWAHVYRDGPIARTDLPDFLLRDGEQEIDASLSRLLADGRLQAQPGPDGQPRYRSGELVIGLDAPVGFEAAVFDHYQAVVRTVCSKLTETPRAKASDRVGGSTYTFTVWPGHPMLDEVYAQLGRQRRELSALRARVDAYNAQQGVPDEHLRVLNYVGQCVQERDDGHDGGEQAHESE